MLWGETPYFIFFFFKYSIWEEEGMTTHSIMPGESHGQRSLVGYSPWGRKESDTTDVTLHAGTSLAGW